MSSLISRLSMGSVRSPSSLYWRLALWHLGQSVMCLLPFYRLRSSRSQQESQRRGLLGWLRWGVFAALGLYLGLSTEIADQLMLRGRFMQASELSPWNRYIRTRVGYAALQYDDVNTAIATLKTDPWSGDLTYGIAALYYAHGDKDNSEKYATRFVEIAPHSVYIQRAK